MLLRNFWFLLLGGLGLEVIGLLTLAFPWFTSVSLVIQFLSFVTGFTTAYMGLWIAVHSSYWSRSPRRGKREPDYTAAIIGG